MRIGNDKSASRHQSHNWR